MSGVQDEETAKLLRKVLNADAPFPRAPQGRTIDVPLEVYGAPSKIPEAALTVNSKSETDAKTFADVRRWLGALPAQRLSCLTGVSSDQAFAGEIVGDAHGEFAIVGKRTTAGVCLMDMMRGFLAPSVPFSVNVDLTALPRVGRVGVHLVENRGSLDPVEIKNVIQSHKDPIRDCYQRGEKRTGTLRSQFIIDSTGRVRDATAQSSELDSKTTDCILEVLKTLTYPEPIGGGIVVVNYPFAFKPDATPAAH